jgi:hypothetical protein
MKYDLKNPCALCPFRNDAGRLYVHPTTLEGMAAGEFCCHKTGKVDDETGDIEPTRNSQHCAGALIMLEKMNRPHQMMRISERLGRYDRRKLNMEAPVFGSFEEAKKQTEAQWERNRRRAQKKK